MTVEGGHEAQRVRRELLVAAKDPSLQAPADALAARDEALQKERSLDATPKPRRYELVPVPLTRRRLSSPGFPAAGPCPLSPIALRGGAATRTNDRGTLNDASRRRQAAESGRVGLAGEAGHGHLAPARVGHAEDGRLAHSGLLQENVLDLAGVDVEAPADDGRSARPRSVT